MHGIDRKSILSLILIVVAFQAMGGLMGYITSQDVGTWYQTLNRSPVNPPDWAFGVVWTTLYILLAVALWKVWEGKDLPDRKIVLGLFAGHMLFNWAWTPVFFTAHLVLPALLIILAMIFTAAMLAWLVRPLGLWVSLVFVPYIAWLTLAGHLTYYIWMKN